MAPGNAAFLTEGNYRAFDGYRRRPNRLFIASGVQLNESIRNSTRCVLLISADAEWRTICNRFRTIPLLSSPFGEYFRTYLGGWECVFFQGGWGKIAAAASAQHVIDRFKPELLINLGTCGGFAGQIERGEIVLVEQTVVYDIYEQMGDPQEHIAHYRSSIDLSWLPDPTPYPVVRTSIVSGDRDLLADDLPMLRERYQALAGDWESGAIAWVAARNHQRLLILRGVTDLVGEAGSPAYNHPDYFENAAAVVMNGLVDCLPGWLQAATGKKVG